MVVIDQQLFVVYGGLAVIWSAERRSIIVHMVWMFGMFRSYLIFMFCISPVSLDTFSCFRFIAWFSRRVDTARRGLLNTVDCHAAERDPEVLFT